MHSDKVVDGLEAAGGEVALSIIELGLAMTFPTDLIVN